MILLLLAACSGSDPADASPTDAVDVGTRFAFPLLEPERFYQVVGVDHDPEVQTSVLGRAICADYVGRPFPWCYDEHHGSDFLLEGAFEAMDADSPTIHAAADGVVVSTVDGNYDHCHVQETSISCDGFPEIANHVIVEHADGLQSRYWHMMKGSVAVAVGDEVRRGDVLGRVGSSGTSSMPHLHFQVEDSEGNVIDPYAGPFSQETSYWCDQGEPDALPGPCAE